MPVRPVRTLHIALLGLILVLAACAPASQGEEPGPSEGGAPSEAEASTDGGGGGGGEYGSITYEFSGDVTQSGELPFLYIPGVGGSTFVEGGWQSAFFQSEADPAVIQINSNPSSHIFSYGDGTYLITGTEDLGCTFNYSQNDASGLVGTIDCTTTGSSNTVTGAILNVSLHAEVNAHT